MGIIDDQRVAAASDLRAAQFSYAVGGSVSPEAIEARAARDAEIARATFRQDYTAELARARSKGYTEEHDHEHGPQHLLDWATEYVYRGEPIKAAAMIAAARALLACTVHDHFASTGW